MVFDCSAASDACISCVTYGWGGMCGGCAEVPATSPPVDQMSCLVRLCVHYPSSKHGAGRQCGARHAGACCLFPACWVRPWTHKPASRDCVLLPCTLVGYLYSILTPPDGRRWAAAVARIRKRRRRTFCGPVRFHTALAHRASPISCSSIDVD